MRHANYSVDILQSSSQELVREDARRVLKAEQTMVGEYSADAEKVRVEDCFVAERRETGVCVNQVDVLPCDDGAKVWEKREIVWQSCRGCYRGEREIVYLERG